MISASQALADSSEDLQYRRKLLGGIRHAVCCETQACSSYVSCKQLKQLWIHMQNCHLPCCSHSICSLMKSILLHFQNCSIPADCSLCSCLTAPNPSQAATEEIIPISDMEKGSDTNEERPRISPSKAKEIKLHLVLLKHALNCAGLNCTSTNCQKMREFIQHHKTCSGSGSNPTMVSGESVTAVAEEKDECMLCRRITNLYKLHSGICRDRSCSLRVCQEKRRKSRKDSKSDSVTGKLQEMKLK
jgi:hypothetical protein